MAAKEVAINPHTNKPVEEFPKWIDSVKEGKKLIVNNAKEEAEHTEAAPKDTGWGKKNKEEN